ncbi:MAG: CaiB/BaiF CoA transferase family protein [Halobacteria archaeon]
MNLDGVRILDLTRLLPGPFATQLLQDMGAEVIKIESPGKGDYARYTPPYTDEGVGGLFSTVNRGKRSVELDLKSSEGKEVFYRLCGDVDVVIEQFRPNVKHRLEVDYESVREHNPDVVYCSLTGYGQNGRYSEKPGHDLNYEALGGLLGMTRSRVDPDGEAGNPVIPGYPVGDMSGGLYAAFAVVSGLLSREFGNGGEYIDVSMTDALLSFSQAALPDEYLGSGAGAGETALTGKYPCYDVYEAEDGYVALAAMEPKFWRKFCRTVGRQDLVTEHMNEDPERREDLRKELEELFSGRTRKEWVELDDVPIEAVNTLREAMESPVTEGTTEPKAGVPRVSNPVCDDVEDGDVPSKGEDTEEILKQAGFGDAEIDELRDKDVV